MKKPYFAVAALVALASCTTPFQAKVSRFQALPAPNGQTFIVQSSDPRLQGGIEFGQYAQLVVGQLSRQGYTPAADPSRADLVVKLAYRVDAGREKVQSYPGGYGGFGYGGFGGGFGGYGGGFGGYRGGYGGFGYGGFGYRPYLYGFYDPFLFGGYGGFNDVRSYTVYTSELDLQIDRTDNGQRVFEGTARAMSSDNDLPHLVPNLIDAMFTGFPGNSGETVKITIAPPPKR